MLFAGRLDPIDPFNGGPPQDFKPGVVADVCSAKACIQSWHDFNDCSLSPQASRGLADATYQRWAGKDHTEVAWWVLDNGGHTWPGGHISPGPTADKVGPLNTSVNATEEIWAFCQRHTL